MNLITRFIPLNRFNTKPNSLLIYIILKCIDSESLIQLFVGRENTERDFRNLISILLVESLENKGCDLCQQPQFDCRIKKSQCIILY